MSAQNNGGPAFPTAETLGISFRDYIATKVLAASFAGVPGLLAMEQERLTDYAKFAYAAADAMLAHRDAGI